MADPTGGGGFLGLEKLLDWAWAILSGVFAWGWAHTHNRIDRLHDDLSDTIAMKADAREFDRQRDNIDRISSAVDQQGQQLARIETKIDMLPKRRGDRDRHGDTK